MNVHRFTTAQEAADDAAACRANAPVTDDAFVERVLEREAITDHDVAAFVDGAPRRSRRAAQCRDAAKCSILDMTPSRIFRYIDILVEK